MPEENLPTRNADSRGTGILLFAIAILIVALLRVVWTRLR